MSVAMPEALVTTRRTCFCVLSTCKNVGNRTASVREIVHCKHVQLTTCATYDARNRSRPGVACRPHYYTLRNRASDVRVTCVDATPSPHLESGRATPSAVAGNGPGRACGVSGAIPRGSEMLVKSTKARRFSYHRYVGETPAINFQVKRRFLVQKRAHTTGKLSYIELMPRSHGSYDVEGATSGGPGPVPEEVPVTSGRRRCMCISVVLLLAMCAVAIGLALGIYFGLYWSGGAQVAGTTTPSTTDEELSSGQEHISD
ncbi:hypothetical protein Bbelb_057090 [Branchiostoma belcheri]|nr:hypothetical protein Bbelb_057090 [Branchiostoma belcheri]